MARLVHRAFAVLRALNESPANLNRLHEQTDLHRATLLRILDALIQEGMVRRAIGGDTYHLKHCVKLLGRKISKTDLLAEAASEHLQSYSSLVRWPTDVLHLHATQPCLVVAETNRPGSPFPVKPNRIRHTVPLVPSAAGRAYLAFMKKSRREHLLRKAERLGYFLQSPHIKPGHLEKDLEAVRQKGYGTRADFFRGGDYLEKRIENDGLLALAVPVLNGTDLIAVLNTQWNAKAYDEAGFSSRYLAGQIELAAAIAADFQRLEREKTLSGPLQDFTE